MVAAAQAEVVEGAVKRVREACVVRARAVFDAARDGRERGSAMVRCREARRVVEWDLAAES